jgi:signal peptidase I
MSLPSAFRRWFGKSAEPTIPPLTALAAIGPRMKVGDRGILANTGSMEPLYTTGDTFTIVERDFEHINYWDIAVAYWEGRQINVPHRVIGHRVAANGETYYIIKGDANSTRDSNLTRREYIGVARFDKDINPA